MASVENVANMVGADVAETSSREPVPVEHLDYAYVKSCDNVNYLARILQVLKSGREGRYPHLEQTTADKIRKLDPEHRVLRQDIPLMTKKHLNQSERAKLEAQLSEFEQSSTAMPVASTSASRNLPPVRGTKEVKVKASTKSKPAEASAAAVAKQSSAKPSLQGKDKRIPGFDFRAWDKYDVDAALAEVDSDDDADNSKDADKSDRPAAAATKAGASNLSAGNASTTLPPSQVSDLPLDPALRHRRADHERLKGNECMRAGDYAEAVVYYTRSVSIMHSVAAVNNRCLAHLKLEQYDQAESDANSVLGREPDNVKALLRRGSARKQLGRLEDARSDLERCCQLQPGHKEATRLLKAMAESHNDQFAKEQQAAVAQQPRKATRIAIQEVDEDSSDDDDENDQIDNDNGSNSAAKQDTGPGTTGASNYDAALPITASASKPSPFATPPSPSTAATAPAPMPADVAALEQQAKTKFDLGQYDLALELYQQAREKLPDAPAMTGHRVTLLTAQADCTLRNGGLRQACQLCEQALALDDRHVKAYLLRASALEQREKFADAIHDLRAVLTLQPSSTPAQQGQARCLKALRSLGEPIPPAKPVTFRPTATHAEPISTSKSASTTAAATARPADTNKASEVSCASASDTTPPPPTDAKSGIPPSTKPSLSSASAAPSASSNEPAPLATTTKSASIPSNKPTSTVPASTRKAQQAYDELKAKGNACVKRKEYQQAIAHYSACIHMEPTVTAAFNNRALCWLQLNQPERAAADATVVLNSEPSNVKALFRLAQACAKCGREDEARRALTQVLQLEPKNKAAQAALDKLPKTSSGTAAGVKAAASAQSQKSVSSGGISSASKQPSSGSRKVVIEEVEEDSDEDESAPATMVEMVSHKAEQDRDEEAQALAERLNTVRQEHHTMQQGVDKLKATVAAKEQEVQALHAQADKVEAQADALGNQMANVAQDMAEAMQASDADKSSIAALPTTAPTSSPEFLSLFEQHHAGDAVAFGRWLLLTPPSKLVAYFSNQLEPWMIKSYVVSVAVAAQQAVGESARSAAIGAFKRLRNLHHVNRFTIQLGLLGDLELKQVQHAARQVAEVVAERAKGKITVAEALKDLAALLS